ncbi:MAG: hypothetical protein ACLGHG_09125 [Gammaproteobacteria bacterium]
MLTKARKLSRRFTGNRESIRRDLGLAVRHLPTLPFLAWPLRAEPEVHGELDPRSYNSVGDMATVIYQAVVPVKRKPISSGTLVCQPDYPAQEAHPTKWFFINGIMTSPPLAIINAQEIARAFRRPVHLIHTPTYGFAWDLWDSITARTLRKDGHLSRPAFYVVQRALEQHERVVLVCHSQGTIVASYIVRKLLKHPSTRHLVRRLEIYCIAGVADGLHLDPELSREAGHPVPYVEHFSNGLDFFCRIGILAHLELTAGKVFNIAGRTGHLLNEHYIPGSVRGDYCGRQSRLYRYANGREPGAYDWSEPLARQEEHYDI